MTITLISHRQVDILEKIVSREFSDAEITNYYAAYLVDDRTGEPILNQETGEQSTIKYDWTGGYVVEAFVNVLETFLLSEKIGIVCPMQDEMPVIGEHWSTVMEAKDFVVFPYPEPSLDKGVFELSFFEWLYGPGNEEDLLMWVRAYNGQFDDLEERVVLRLTESDLRRLQTEINIFNEAHGLDERIGEDCILTSPAIFRAYQALCSQYKVEIGKIFANMTDLVLPPLATAFLGRLPARPSRDAMLEALFELRKELEPVRRKFETLTGAEDPDVTAAEAQKAVSAINADAKRFAAKWNSAFTDRAAIQFCLENVSFVLKCILRPDKIEAEEVAKKLVDIAPRLERYLRSSAPTQLSRIALETRKIRDIKRLFEVKLGLQFED